MESIYKKYRLLRGYSQEYLAEKMTLSTRQIQRIENGESNPSFETFKDLIMLLNISNDDIIKIVKEKK